MRWPEIQNTVRPRVRLVPNTGPYGSPSGTIAADDAFGAFYLHLQTKNAHLLTFPSDGPFKAVREWLAEEGLIKP